MLSRAHRDGDDDTLRRIYGYASWAREQPDDDIQNAAGVAFYEHLFDEQWMRPLVIRGSTARSSACTWGCGSSCCRRPTSTRCDDC
jgi:hypothetical protein